jgi:hypothetical protein
MDMLFSFSLIKLIGEISVGFDKFLLNNENFFFASTSDKSSTCFIKSSASGDLLFSASSLIYL